ncbi:MAG: DUF58 domain-containing protein [Opitutales bacterium]
MPDSQAITRDILKKVRQLEIRTRREVTDAMIGAYHSSFRGQGMDFEEVREYAPGDDVRDIDWNVTARMDRPFVKKFREERELTIMLMLDLSASGSFGSAEQSKRERAAEIASVLAFSATRNNDKVGLILYTDRIEQVILPRKGRSHVLQVIRDMLFFEPEGARTDTTAALEFCNRLLKRRAIVFLLTDFLQGPDGQLPDPDRRERGSLFQRLALTARHHDLISIVLTDPREWTMPDVGLVTLEDAETGEVIELDTGNRRARANYQRRSQTWRQRLEKALAQAGTDSLFVSTDQPYIHALRRFLDRRGQRL